MRRTRAQERRKERRRRESSMAYLRKSDPLFLSQIRPLTEAIPASRSEQTLVGFRLWHRVEVEPPLPLLVEHAITSGPATAHVHPIGWHDDDRSRTEFLG